MRLIVTIHNINQISLPIAYHHIQQSAIYALIAGDLHDNGVQYQKRDYKLFTFGPFMGKYRIQNHRITFYNQVSFEFRCQDEEVMDNVVRNLNEKGFRLGDITYHNIELYVEDVKINSNRILVKMCSPVCVYETDDFKHTYYLTPNESRFYDLIEDNFRRKYTATYGSLPNEEFYVELERFSERDKYFTKYKDFYIEAWKGYYILSGAPGYLTFLYNTGIGSKNSQGFGMYEIVDKNRNCNK